MRMTVAHADVATDVQDAMRIAEHALERDDGVHMACAPFEKFAVQPEIQALYGKVSLVLTDPPYNTRREAGATNSEHDKFSSTDMQKAADLIAGNTPLPPSDAPWYNHRAGSPLHAPTKAT